LFRAATAAIDTHAATATTAAASTSAVSPIFLMLLMPIFILFGFKLSIPTS
jgi:hypothetical protein